MLLKQRNRRPQDGIMYTGLHSSEVEIQCFVVGISILASKFLLTTLYYDEECKQGCLLLETY